VIKPNRRNLEASLKGVFEPGCSCWRPCACKSDIRKCLIAAPVIDRDKYRRRRHGLHVPDHSAAFRTLRISPVGVSEPRDAMFNVVQIQDPIGSGRRPKAFAFNDELSPAFLRIRLVSIKVNPLNVRTLLFPACTRPVVRVRLITAFSYRCDLIVRV
jgi:hypothetical protein